MADGSGGLKLSPQMLAMLAAQQGGQGGAAPQFDPSALQGVLGAHNAVSQLSSSPPPLQGVLGPPSQPPPASSAALPAPQQPPPPPQHGGGMGGVLGGIANGIGSVAALPFGIIGGIGANIQAGIERTQMQRATAVATYQQFLKRLQAIGEYRATLNPAAQKLFDLDPFKASADAEDLAQKLQSPEKLAAGESLGSAAHGIFTTAPVPGFDAATGRGYSVAGNGALSASAGSTGSMTAIDPTTGAVYDPRGGGVQAFISKFESSPVTNTNQWATPTLTPNGEASGGGSAPDQTLTGGGAPGADGGPIVPSHVPGSANAPRGLRNNNAGNLRALGNGQAWNGQVGQDKDGYLQFATPQDGVRAALVNLQAKQNKHGLNTVAGIISAPHVGWDPGNSNYSKYVAQRLGVDPTAPINVNDPATAKGLLNAIFAFENGPRAMAASGVEPTGAAPGGAQPASPPVPSGSPALNVPVTQPGQTRPATVRTSGGTTSLISQGRTTQALSAAESAALGAPPGTILQRAPDGTLSPVVQRSQTPLPPDDQARLVAMKDKALKMAQLSQLAQQFVGLNAKQDTGGYHAIPGESEVESAFNPTITDMSSLTKEMIPLQRDIGSGPIRVGEIQGPGGGIWGGDVPRVQAPRQANAFTAQNWTQTAKQYQDYANFADQWAQTHPTLNGMDAAWAKQNGGTLSHLPTPSGSQGGPVTLNPQNPNADYQALQHGARYIGPDGKVRIK